MNIEQLAAYFPHNLKLTTKHYLDAYKDGTYDKLYKPELFGLKRIDSFTFRVTVVDTDTLNGRTFLADRIGVKWFPILNKLDNTDKICRINKIPVKDALKKSFYRIQEERRKLLLINHFDIFGLIGKGKAIDYSTIKRK